MEDAWKTQGRRPQDTGNAAKNPHREPDAIPRVHPSQFPMRGPAMTPFRLLLIAAVMTLTACETVEGFGEDVQSAGQAIESEAVEAQ